MNNETRSQLIELVAKAKDAFGRELRTVKAPDIEVRRETREDGEETATLYGHAAVFDQETVIGGYFREVIEPGAFKKTIQEADVRHLFNHDPNLVLARTTNGTLSLAEDDSGLYYEASLNMKDPDAVSVAAKVERKDVSQSSFAFRAIQDAWEEGDIDEAGVRRLPLRRVREAQLYDTSTVTYPAYEQAETMLRSAGLDILSHALGLEGEEREKVLMALVTGNVPVELAEALTRAAEALDLPAPDFVAPVEVEDQITPPAAEEAPARAAEEAPEIDPIADEVIARLQLRLRHTARDRGLPITSKEETE